MIVMRVNMSPAFAPNALEPPMPPRAPAKPPPRPRCTSTSRIKKIAKNDNIRASSATHGFSIRSCLNPLCRYNELVRQPAAMPRKSSAFRLAPPTRAPSMFGCDSSSPAFEALTLPPYRIRTFSADPSLYRSVSSLRRSACTSSACCGDGHFAGANGPNRLVGDDRFLDLLGRNAGQRAFELAADDGCRLPGFALGQQFADADDRDQPCGQSGDASSC